MSTTLSKLEFLSQLENKLAVLPENERRNALDYYDNFISASADEGATIASLGAPGEVAADILAGYVKKSSHAAPIPNAPPTPHFESSGTSATPVAEKCRSRNWWLIAILIIFSPAIIGLVVGVGGGLFGLVAGLASAIFAFAVSGFTFIATGIASVVFSVFIFFQDAGFGLLSAGTGLMLIGIGILLVMLTVSIAKWIISLIKTIVRRLQNGRVKTTR